MRTRLAAAAILGMVFVFILAVAGTLIAKSRMPPAETAGSVASSADLRIKEAQIEEVTGGVRWRLKAEQALIFEAEGRTALRAIAVDVFERDRSWTIVGEEGDLFQATKNLEIATSRVVPDWLSLNKEAFKGTVVRIPTRDEIQPMANEQAVVEFYSR